MKVLTPANISAFTVFSLGGVLNHFGSNPRILYLPALAVCFWIMYQTHAYVSDKEAKSKQEPSMKEERANIITTTNQSGGQNIIAEGDVNLGPERRDLTPDKRAKYLGELKNAPKGKIDVAVVNGDEGTHDFAEQIRAALQSIGYSTGPDMSSFNPIGGRPPQGVTIVLDKASHVPQSSTDALQRAFKAIDIDAPARIGDGPRSPGPDSTSIEVAPNQ